MNDNTILRIKVPAHLYESVKEQLTITEAAKAKKQFGAEFTVVKEKKLPKDGMKKVEEKMHDIEEAKHEVEEAPVKKERTLEELMAAKSKLEKKIEEMQAKMKDEVKHEVEEAKHEVEEKKEEE